MSLTIDLAPEVEERLRQQAESQNLPLEEFVAKSVAAIAFGVAANKPTPQERLKAFRAATAYFEALNLPPLPDEAFERESFYEDDRGL